MKVDKCLLFVCDFKIQRSKSSVNIWSECSLDTNLQEPQTGQISSAVRYWNVSGWELTPTFGLSLLSDWGGSLTLQVLSYLNWWMHGISNWYKCLTSSKLSSDVNIWTKASKSKQIITITCNHTTPPTIFPIPLKSERAYISSADGYQIEQKPFTEQSSMQIISE